MEMELNTVGLSSQNCESEYEEDKDIPNDVKEVQEDKQKVNKNTVEKGIQI